MSWSDGYPVSGVHRPLYHASTGPVFAGQALRLAGFDPGPLVTCCELGFGMGVSLAIHAAVGGSWWGTDVMPDQVAAAMRLAPKARLYDEGFAEYCARTDLPVFDFVAIHGVWTWISADMRRLVLDFLRRRLRPGGVLLVSYNTAVGWSSLLPLRHALMRHAATSTPRGLGEAVGAERALPAIQALFDAGSVYAERHPLAPEILARMHGTPGQMLVHEFMGAHWTPFHFGDVAEEMAQAKLSFACQAGRLTAVPRLFFTAEQRAILDEIPDPVFRECVAEILTGERYRRDYWVKGALRMGAEGAGEAEDALRYVLVAPPGEVVLEPDLPQGQIAIPMAFAQPVLDALSGHGPRSFAEIAAGAAAQGLDRSGARDALMLLWDAGVVQPAQSEEAAEASAPGCERLNARVIEAATRDGRVEHLANPVTGGGVPVSIMQQRLLWAERQGHKTAEAQAAAAGCETGAAERFAAGLRPILRRHGVA